MDYLEDFKQTLMNNESDPSMEFWSARVFNAFMYLLSTGIYEAMSKDDIVNLLTALAAYTPTDVLLQADLMRQALGMQPEMSVEELRSFGFDV